MNNNAVIVEKIIYAKRRGLTPDQIKSIFIIEIEDHLRKNPGLYFLKIGEPTKNNDQSKTFHLYFDLKINKLNKKN